mgnify:CR=1 FL=1
MTASVPESFSMDELESALDQARHEDECHASNESDKYSPEFIRREIEAGLDQMLERIQDPCVHKIAMQMICSRMIDYHTQMALQVNSQSSEHAIVQCMTAWMRDAGKFQAVATILSGISMGDNDFACDQE